MRGLGKVQEKVWQNNSKRVLKVIFSANTSKRFATISEIFAKTGINHASIRNHLQYLIDNGQIVEYSVYNNARGFIEDEGYYKLFKAEFYENTKQYIYNLKYPNLKPKSVKINAKTRKMVRKLHHLD